MSRTAIALSAIVSPLFDPIVYSVSKVANAIKIIVA